MNAPEPEKHAPYLRELGDGLVLKTAVNQADIERVATCYSAIFDADEGKDIGGWCRRLFLYHPNTQLDDLIFVEDEKTGEVISAICLLPWQWRYEDAALRTGEMGMVGTLEPYRHRGLIRAQIDYFRELDLSNIQGIPGFYQRFGYEYAIPFAVGFGGYRLELHQIPDQGGGGTSRFTCRPEAAADLPTVKRLYDEAAQELAIHACKDDAIWQYLSKHASVREVEPIERWIVEDTDKRVVGYFRTQKHPCDEEMVACEVSLLSYDAALAVFRHLKKLAIERKKPNIRLGLPSNCALVQIARYYGASYLDAYAWQIHIPDIARFLRTISPVLGRRLAESPFAGLTEAVRINFDGEVVALYFRDGQIAQVGLSGTAEGSICIPRRAAVPLILGYRSREELRGSSPVVEPLAPGCADEVYVIDLSPKESHLIDLLFPRMASYIYTIY